MTSRVASRVDPVEWANKRKAQLEKSKQLKEERKSGIGSSEHTFAPQVNKRPSYLDSNKPAPAIIPPSDDPFEQPLPGSKNRNVAAPIMHTPLSPNSDALGKEVKKYNGFSSNNNSSNNLNSNGVNNNNHNFDNNNGISNSNAGGYKSNFMKQQIYENADLSIQPSNPRANPPQQQQYQNQNPVPKNGKVNEDVVANDLFANQLRGDDGNSGWNNDISVPGTFAEVKRANPRRPRPQQQQQQQAPENYSQQGNVKPTQSRPQVKEFNFDMLSEQPPAKVKVSPRAPWDSDLGGGISGGGGGIKTSPRTHGNPVNYNGSNAGGGMMAGGDKPVPASKSRLSLLKSKIRKSESGGTGRGVVDGDFPMVSASAPPTMPKTAPNDNKGFGRFDDEDDVGHRTNGNKGMNHNYSNNNSNANLASNGSGDSYDPSVEMLRQNRQHRQVPLINGPARRIQQQQQEEQERAEQASHPNSARRMQQQQQQQQQQQARPQQQQTPQQQQQQSQQQKQMERERQEQERQREVEQFRQQMEQEKSQQSQYPGEFPDEDIYTGPLEECPDCHRKFRPDVIEKHVRICAKVFLQKRKAFDSSKMRVQGIEDLEQVLAQKAKEEKKAKAAEKRNAGRMNAAAAADNRPAGAGDGDGEKAAWKQKSNAFREAMKAAREYSKAVATGAPLPPPVISAPDNSLIPCPHCNRRFNEKAAERHIPQCQNIKARPTALKRGSGGVAKGGTVTGVKGGGVKF